MSYVVSAPTNVHAKEIIGFPNGFISQDINFRIPTKSIPAKLVGYRPFIRPTGPESKSMSEFKL